MLIKMDSLQRKYKIMNFYVPDNIKQNLVKLQKEINESTNVYLLSSSIFNLYYIQKSTIQIEKM